MKNALINLITFSLGFMGVVFITVFGLVFSGLLLVLALIAKPFMNIMLKQKLDQVQMQREKSAPEGGVFEGKCERVYK